MPPPAIDIYALLTNEEENLKLEQINATHLGILDLLGDPGNHCMPNPTACPNIFYTMMIGAHSVGELPVEGIAGILRCPVLDLDEEYLGLAECIVEWQVTRRGTAPMPTWHPPNFGQLEQSCYDKEPDLQRYWTKPSRPGQQTIFRYRRWP